MKIKVDHYIAKKIAEAAEVAINDCIAFGLMTKKFEVADIKGTVWVGKAPGLYGETNTYQYSVDLFGRIHLATGAYFVKHLGFTQDVQRTVIGALGRLMEQGRFPQENVQTLFRDIALSFGNPGKKFTIEYFEELKIELEYNDNPDDQHVFFVSISKQGKQLAYYHNYGDTKEEVLPQATGLAGVLANVVGTFRPSKPQDFFITEHTVFHCPNMGYHGGVTAMINQNPEMQPAYAYVNGPLHANQFNDKMNTNDPSSSF